MTTRIYIAGASKDIERCEKWRDRCIGVGIEITEDWMAGCRLHGANAAAPEILLSSARADIRAVETADYVWLLAPPFDKPSAGCWAELDRALCRIVPVIYSPPPDVRAQFCIFTTLIPGAHSEGLICTSDEEAFAALLKRVAGRIS